MCIESRSEIFVISVLCATYNAVFVMTHTVNFAAHIQFAALHGFYVALHSLGFIISMLFFVSVITRRATPMEVGVFLCKLRIIITSSEIGYLAYRVARGYYDLPLHFHDGDNLLSTLFYPQFFKRRDGNTTMPYAWMVQRGLSRSPHTERDWRKFYHLSYIFLEITILSVDVYATWRIDLYIDKVLYQRLFF